MKLVVIFISFFFIFFSLSADTNVAENILAPIRYALDPAYPQPDNITSSKVKVAGHDMYYACNRKLNQNAENILLLHGFCSSRFNWYNMMTLLIDQGYNVYAPDLPGYGQSMGYPVQDYQIERQVELLHEFCKLLKLEEIHLAGNSLGGSVAVIYTDKYSDMIKSVGILGSPGGYSPWAPEISNVFAQGDNIFVPLTEESIDVGMELIYYHKAKVPQQFITIVLKMNRTHLAFYDKVTIVVLVKALYNYGIGGMPKVNKPMLLIWGKNDKVFAPEYAEKVQRENPGCSKENLIMMDKAGHGLIVEYPEKVFKLYYNFLKNLKEPAK